MSQNAYRTNQYFSQHAPPRTEQPGEIVFAQTNTPPSDDMHIAEQATPTATVTTISPHGGAYALSSRRAARINAAHAAGELTKWIDERKILLDRHFAGTITAEERRRLRYVRWNIDRIQDAQNGEILDLLESFVARYEKFRADIQDFRQQLESVRRRNR